MLDVHVGNSFAQKDISYREKCHQDSPFTVIAPFTERPDMNTNTCFFIILIAAASLCDALTGCSTFIQEAESNEYNYCRKSNSHGVRAPDLVDYLACMTVTADCHESSAVSDLIITPYDISNSSGALQHCP